LKGPKKRNRKRNQHFFKQQKTRGLKGGLSSPEGSERPPNVRRYTDKNEEKEGEGLPLTWEGETITPPKVKVYPHTVIQPGRNWGKGWKGTGAPSKW